jgi:hypothetical protein
VTPFQRRYSNPTLSLYQEEEKKVPFFRINEWHGVAEKIPPQTTT